MQMGEISQRIIWPTSVDHKKALYFLNSKQDLVPVRYVTRTNSNIFDLNLDNQIAQVFLYPVHSGYPPDFS